MSSTLNDIYCAMERRASFPCRSAVATGTARRDFTRVTTYIVFVKIGDEWTEITEIEAADHAEAIRKAELALPAEHRGKALGLKPLRESSVSTQSPKCGTPEN
jgi:hypothetical protein